MQKKGTGHGAAVYRSGESLKTLIELAALVNSSLDIAHIREKAIGAAMALFDAEAGSLLFVDESTGELYFDVALGDKGSEVKKVRLARGQGIAGWVALHGEPAIVNDVRADGRFFYGADSESGFVTRNVMCAPVTHRGRTLGVLQAVNKRAGDFEDRDLDLLAALSNQVAVAMENARLYKELEGAFFATVDALAETIEKRDPYTAGHTGRVAACSVAIGKEMGLSSRQIADLKLSAALHDIGKIGVRDSILLKPDRLEDEEFQALQKHVDYGQQILGHIRQLADVVPAVKCHHEKFDGTGYTCGISGGAIPLAARIIAVADTFDAMTSDRPYRKGLPPETAMGELKRCSGTQFDPAVVEAFIRVFLRDGGIAEQKEKP